jgi:hypothetical protein
LIELRLKERVVRKPTQRVTCSRYSEIADRLTVRSEMQPSVVGADKRLDDLDEIGALEQPHDFRIEVRRSGQGEDFHGFIDDAGSKARATGEYCSGRPDGAHADDENVIDIGGQQLLLLGKGDGPGDYVNIVMYIVTYYATELGPRASTDR